MTLPAKTNGSDVFPDEDTELHYVYERLCETNNRLASLEAFDFKEAIKSGELALRSIRSARLSERLTRIENSQRELGKCLGKTQFIEARLALVETALSQILEEQRKPWWRKVFRW